MLDGASDDNKRFYSLIKKELDSIGTKEDVFITGLCDDIVENVNIDLFINGLKSLLGEA